MELPRQTAIPIDEPVALQEARDFCEYPNTDRDDLFREMIVAATDVVEREVGRQLITSTWELSLNAFPTSPFYLGDYHARPPFQTVESITYLDLDGESQTLATTVYAFSSQSESGRVSLKYQQTWPSARNIEDAVTIEFKNGYGEAPADVPSMYKVLIKEMVLAWWRRDTSVGDLTVAMRRLIWLKRRVA